ncbi:MAG: diguanylate cyclase [Actinomycetota bacterium]|nr:diguanylate cyclase [Actinomycetota bacterium]
MTVRDRAATDRGQPTLDSYRRLAEVFHDVLSEHSSDALLDRIADTLDDLIPYDTLTIYRAVESDRLLVPVMARDQWADEIMDSRMFFGEGLTGWAAEHREPVLANQAHLDPRTQQIPGTPEEPEALISVPLVTGSHIKGVLNIYRIGEAEFSEGEFELARSFGDAAALALDNADSRANLERLAHTDSLTGLYNHRFFHERLRAELTRATRVHDSVTVLMLDIDDFKKVNDIFGHAVGDQILASIAEMLGEMVRGSDLACRIGGEELALIMPSCHAGDALGFARRLRDRLAQMAFDPVGRVTVSVGIAQGPEHAMNPRDLLACAEGAMMTVKARGKNGVLLYEYGQTERPRSTEDRDRSDVRSIAHMKMLQSLAGKLNRLNEVQQIASTIANELRTLIDYHGCRVYQADGDYLIPIAVRGNVRTHDGKIAEIAPTKIGEGITGKAAQDGRSLLIPNALTCEYSRIIPGSHDVAESIIAVPMSYGSRALGVIVISKLGVAQFDEDDVRLLEVLAGHASVAVENARLYEAQRREAESAKALLECADVMAKARTSHAIADETVDASTRLLEAPQASLWVFQSDGGEYRCVSHQGFAGDVAAQTVIRRRIPKDTGQGLLRGRKLPFVLDAETLAEFYDAADVMTKACAVAPLHGIDGWILVPEPANGIPHFTEQRLRLLAGISYQTSVAMQKADFYIQQKENAEIASALLDFSRELAAAEGTEETLAKIVEQASRIMGSPQTTVWLQDENGDLRPGALWGYEEAEAKGVSATAYPKELVAPFVDMSEPFVLQAKDLQGVLRPEVTGRSAAYAIAPVKLEGGRVGFITSAAPALGDYEFSPRKMRLLAGIAHQSVLAINSGSSFENLERTFFDTVEALANALEARDEYTSTHARWITDTSIEVGRVLGLDTPALKRLELGALFHDIGKIGISNDILQKPGPLTDEEWVIMRQHPEMGARILEPIERLADVRPIVRACHEHYDGSGYPDGLAGDAIPVESRIILVVDAFHAMTTDRPYRKGLSVEEARRRLERSSGTQFDPAVVDALEWLFNERPELTETA